MGQNEICNDSTIRSVSVLDDHGQPQNFGWSKIPCFFYDPLMIYAPRSSVSESDRYIIHSPTHLIVFEIRDDGWLGYVSISIISMRDKKRSTQIYRTLLPLGSFELPTNSAIGSVKWHKDKKLLQFINMENGVKIIKVDIPKFGSNRSLRGAVVLSEVEGSSSAQSLITNQPWRSEKYAFRYTRCCPCYYVEGVMQFGSSEIIFTRGNAWGIMDWNRGVRPKEDVRYWAAACGAVDGRLLSFCVGYSQADSSAGTENAFFVDGVLHKLDQVTFHIPLSNWLSPWRFTSNDNRLEMTFTPHQERIDRRRVVLYYSTRRQVCGFFSGKVQLDDGSEAEFHNLTGFAERSKMKY